MQSVFGDSGEWEKEKYRMRQMAKIGLLVCFHRRSRCNSSIFSRVWRISCFRTILHWQWTGKRIAKHATMGIAPLMAISQTDLSSGACLGMGLPQSIFARSRDVQFFVGAKPIQKQSPLLVRECRRSSTTFSVERGALSPLMAAMCSIRVLRFGA